MTTSTPFLIKVHGDTFDSYISSLSTNSKKHYSKARNRNQDLNYEQIAFNEELGESYMELWSRQIVWGERVQWEIKLDFLTMLNRQKKIKVFAARNIELDEIICIQWIYSYDQYAFCAEPLYDKEKYINGNLAKYMWFKLIDFAFSDNKLRYIDLGGGQHYSWRDWMRLHGKKGYQGYKFQFIPKYLKDNPALVEDYVLRIAVFKNKIYLAQKSNFIVERYYRLVWVLGLFLYRFEGQRINRLKRSIIGVLKNQA
ncbi:MAG: hypothetical protein ACO2ZZ_05025 [Cyclobacteriaceae bacterium]